MFVGEKGVGFTEVFLEGLLSASAQRGRLVFIALYQHNLVLYGLNLISEGNKYSVP